MDDMQIEPTHDPLTFIVICSTGMQVEDLLYMRDLPHDGKKYPIINKELQHTEPGHYSYLVTVTDPVVK